MKPLRLKAIVLRRTNYGEADRVLQLLTSKGKMSVIAKGVRREKSRLAGGIELLSICEVVIVSGKGDLAVLTSSRLVKFYRHIMDDYDKLQFAYDVMKWVAKASENSVDNDWYEVLANVLAGLDSKSLPINLVKSWFYTRYAILTGYELSLWRDINGDKVSADSNYRYDISERGLVIDEKGDLTASHIKLLRLIATKPLKTLAQIGGIDDFLPICLEVTRTHASI